MRRGFKILFLLLVPMLGNGQEKVTDSLRKALNIARTDSAKFSITTALSTNNMERDWDSALYYSEKALQLAQKNNKQLEIARTLDSKGYVLMHLGRLSESLQCFLPAFKIAEDITNEEKTWERNPTLKPRQIRLDILASIHHDFGHLMRSSGKPDQAIFQYNKTKGIAEELKDTVLLGFVNMNLGNIYLQLNKLDSALLMEEKAATIFKQSGSKKYLAAVYNIIGNIYLKQKNKILAVENFYKGVQSATDQNNLSELSSSYSLLTRFYLDTDRNKDSALYYAKKNLAVLQSMSSKALGNAYKDLAGSYDLNSNIDSAYKYQGLALTINDSDYRARDKTLSEFQKLSFDEQFRMQEEEKERALTKNRNRMYAMLIGLSVLLLIGILLYRNNRQKQKANDLLAKQKEKIESTLQDLTNTQNQLIQSEKMASLGELTAGIAHEIQNPLNFVNNFSEVSNELLDEMKEELAKGNYNDAKEIADDVKQNLAKINHHGKRADAIVKGMLQHSRSSSGTKEPTDINKLADEYLRLAYHGLRAKDKSFNATIKTDFDETIGNINIIPQDIGRVILNLITNAFYVVDEKKKTCQAELVEAIYEPIVSVSTKKLADKVLISVQDNGKGIPQKIIDKIFQPFFTTKPTGQGTGLGLSLAYDIVKAHGGEIKVESREGEGTEFKILLPMS